MWKHLNINEVVAYVGSLEKILKIDGYVFSSVDDTITLFINGDTARTFKRDAVIIKYK